MLMDMTMLKKSLLLFFFSTFSLTSSALSLTNYDAVKNALGYGKRISVSVDFSKCHPSMKVKAFYSPRAVISAGGKISFSLNHFTLNNPRHSGEPMIEYVVYSLSERNIVTIKSMNLDPRSYERKANSIVTVQCQLNRGAKFFAK